MTKTLKGQNFNQAQKRKPTERLPRPWEIAEVLDEEITRITTEDNLHEFPKRTNKQYKKLENRLESTAIILYYLADEQINRTGRSKPIPVL